MGAVVVGSGIAVARSPGSVGGVAVGRAAVAVGPIVEGGLVMGVDVADSDGLTGVWTAPPSPQAIEASRAPTTRAGLAIVPMNLNLINQPLFIREI